VETVAAPTPAPTWTQYVRVTSVLFWGVHVAALAGVFYCGWSWRGLALASASYFVRMFVVTAAYHRYFAHRAFKTSRWFQLLLAIGAQSAAQKGVLWWASHHRWHHKYSDTPRDVHSAKLRGFWYSHLGWIIGENWNERVVFSSKSIVSATRRMYFSLPATCAILRRWTRWSVRR